MKRLGIVLLVGATILMMVPGAREVEADRGSRTLRADLHGFEEPPAVSSTGSGEFTAKISHDQTSFDYELSFEELEGTVTQSHIHLGQRSVNGGISVWLCGTDTNPGPAGTPGCGGPNAGAVKGTVTAANVIGPSGQGVAAGEFAELIKAIREGVTYANVHSTKHPGGEIRGQIKSRDRD
jgi:hypothetical protein